MEKLTALSNIELNKQEGYVLLSINPAIYPLELVYSAAYILMDKAYIILGGDPKEKILVEIRQKRKEQDLRQLAMEFNNELLNYAVYKTQSEKNKTLRETILQRILLTNDPNYFAVVQGAQAQQTEKDEPIEDPEGIMRTWEETNHEQAAKLKEEKPEKKSEEKGKESKSLLTAKVKEKKENGC